MYKLYHYWRSTSSWRVRWALELKKIPCEMIAINLLNGESESEEHLLRNPLGYVPVFEINDPKGSKKTLCESLAIIQYLQNVHPESYSLFPSDPYLNAHTLSLAEIINADTQPIQNLSVLEFYSNDPLLRKKWATHFIQKGLSAFEKIAAAHAGKFSVGDHITLADLCLAPQIYNAFRQEMTLEPFPLLQKIWENLQTEPTFLKSHPDSFKPKDFA